MAENSELEALISEHPDELDGYLVYGDWLEAQGDPRGALVALQAARLRTATDGGDRRALDRAIKEHITKHRGALLGSLAPYTDQQIEVEWRLGFFDRVCLQVHDAQALEALGTLLDNPGARFLRKLEIVQGSRLAADAYLKVLLQAKKPMTLRELRIGSWSLDEDPKAEQLRTVFPRLEQPLGSEWATIREAVAKARRATMRFEPAELPALEAQPGVDLKALIGSDSIDPAMVLNALRLEIDKGRPLGVLPALRRTFTSESLDAFMVAVGEQFTAMGEPTNHRWGFLALGALGGDGAAAWMGDGMRRWSHQRASQGCDLLGKIGTGLSIYELYGIATDPSMRRSRRQSAAQVLAGVAKERGVPVTDLLDRSAPVAAPDAALERARNTAIRRLQKQMVSGRRMSLHELRHYVAEHPLVRPFAERVVWAEFDGREVRATFRIAPPATDAPGARPTFVDAAGASVALNGPIGVVHPAELPEPERKRILGAWQTAFEQAQIEPLFEQLNRPVFSLREQEGGTNLGRFKLRRVDYGVLESILVDDRDWEPFGGTERWRHDDDDGDEIQHGPTSWGKSFKRDNAWVVAALDDSRRAMATVHVRNENEQSGLDASLRRFDELHPVTISEILYDLETAIPEDKPRDRGSRPTREETAAIEEKSGVKKGSRVRLGIHANEGKGKWGIVFWVGERDGKFRCGIRTDDDETIWADVSVLEKVSAEEIQASTKVAEAKKTKTKPQAKTKTAAAAAAASAQEKAELAKGDRVRWRTATASGTGKVFWLGEGKFGGGPRAGVKDDDTGETIWTEVASCQRVE